MTERGTTMEGKREIDRVRRGSVPRRGNTDLLMVLSITWFQESNAQSLIIIPDILDWFYRFFRCKQMP